MNPLEEEFFQRLYAAIVHHAERAEKMYAMIGRASVIAGQPNVEKEMLDEANAQIPALVEAFRESGKQIEEARIAYEYLIRHPQEDPCQNPPQNPTQNLSLN